MVTPQSRPVGDSFTAPDSLTSVPGIRVGHWTHPMGTGCTALLGPFRAAARVSGLATGTREFDPLQPEHLVPRLDGLVLTGGSAFGLSAADGVVRYLEERGEGFSTPAGPVPIVPAAVIFDLAEGRPRPGPDGGYEAAGSASSEPVPQGRVGVGAGATVGKAFGRQWSSPGGVGSASGAIDQFQVGALVVVNPFGDVLGRDGAIVSGAFGPDGAFRDSAQTIVSDDWHPHSSSVGEEGNTTLAVVATDAPLSQVDLIRIAHTAETALARRISPVQTPFDGDIVFALSTAPDGPVEMTDPREVLRLALVARNLLETSILRAVGWPVE